MVREVRRVATARQAASAGHRAAAAPHDGAGRRSAVRRARPARRHQHPRRCGPPGLGLRTFVVGAAQQARVEGYVAVARTRSRRVARVDRAPRRPPPVPVHAATRRRRAQRGGRRRPAGPAATVGARPHVCLVAERSAGRGDGAIQIEAMGRTVDDQHDLRRSRLRPLGGGDSRCGPSVGRISGPFRELAHAHGPRESDCGTDDSRIAVAYEP